MKQYLSWITSAILVLSLLWGCQPKKKSTESKGVDTVMKRKVGNYAKVKLTTDLSNLNPNQIKILSHLINASQQIDDIYWMQAYGDKQTLLDSISDPDMREYALINYGPWDRLNGLTPFTDDFPPRPLGQQFYPPNINQTEFFELKDDNKYSPYTLVKRDNEGKLKVIPFHQEYQKQLSLMAESMNKAAELSQITSFKSYLLKRAEDLQKSNFTESDRLWLEMNDNIFDFIAGPIDSYEDRFLWTKCSYGAFILKKDQDWTKKVKQYTLLIPFLQKNLPVLDTYKKETPSETTDIGIYDVLYNAGYCNAGGKLIALNLPIGNDNLKMATRKVHFKNITQAKFEKILKPISELVIDEKQRKHVRFEAFFLNTLFYEISNALGIKQTINDKGSVKDALKDHNAVIQELKNDVLRMFFITKLHEMRELGEADLMDNYVTYMADVFRSMRFGVTDAQGVANMIRFYYFEEAQAFKYNRKTGAYKVNFYKMKKAILALSQEVLTIQGDGDYSKAKKLISDKGFIRNELLNDLYRIQHQRIPKDLVYDQGVVAMGVQ